MNNFYGILKVISVSDIIFDYYNKCKLYFFITCTDEDDKRYKSKILIKCDEIIIRTFYSKIKVNDYIYVYGKIVKEAIVYIDSKLIYIL